MNVKRHVQTCTVCDYACFSMYKKHRDTNTYSLVLEQWIVGIHVCSKHVCVFVAGGDDEL